MLTLKRPTDDFDLTQLIRSMDYFDYWYTEVMTEHVDFMAEALKQSRLASKDGELPFGAVVVRDGVIISRGR